MLTGWWLIVILAGPALLEAGLRMLKRKVPKLPVTSRQQRREQQGHCHVCGYNLRGVESYQCPECGTVRLYSARQWQAKLASDAAREAEKKQN
jgi:predicted RNA-binding Zn-ribbon protein involved in translation (DUF1610 family)